MAEQKSQKGANDIVMLTKCQTLCSMTRSLQVVEAYKRHLFTAIRKKEAKNLENNEIMPIFAASR